MLPEGRINWTMETPSSKSQDNQGEPHQNGGGKVNPKVFRYFVSHTMLLQLVQM